jgi:glycosyltransferase involved in cell wall biosynthesis
MVTTFYPPYNFGGDGIYVYRLANALARRGHRVDVVHCLDAYEFLSAGRSSSSEEYGNHPNVTVHSLRSRAGLLSLLMTHQTGYTGLHASRLRGLLNDGGFDVIHYHNMSLIGRSTLRFGTGVKLYTMHDHWLVCPLHVLWKFDRMPCTRKQCIPCTVHAKRPPQLWRYTRMPGAMLDHVDAFIVLSHFSREKHREMGLAVRAPIVHLPPFVPAPPPVSRANAMPPHPSPFFLVVGRLEKLKGVQVAIEAFRRYRDCDLVIAGDGPYRARLEQRARGLPHVCFRGTVGPGELQALYRHAIALIVPSIGYETFGTVIVEAFAQRTPAIVHNLGALPEVVTQSGGGMMYDDASGLEDALRTLRSDGGLRDTLGGRGYRAYLKDWTVEAHLERYFALLNGIMARKQAAGLEEGRRA